MGKYRDYPIVLKNNANAAQIALKKIIDHFGSRKALSKATKIAGCTISNYLHREKKNLDTVPLVRAIKIINALCKFNKTLGKEKRLIVKVEELAQFSLRK
jgi:hypothetical protein